MFCSKCGANLPDQARFCTTCGNPVAPAPTAEPAAPANPEPAVNSEPAENLYAAPVNPAPAQPYAAPAQPYAAPAQSYGTYFAAPKLSAKDRGLSKGAFLKREASPAIKRTSVATIFIFLLTAVLILLSAMNVNSAEIWEIPIVQGAFEITGEDMDDLKSELDEAVEYLDEAEDFLDEIEEEYGSEAAEMAEEMIDLTRETASDFSINNVIEMLAYAEKLSEEAGEDVLFELDLDDDVETMSDVALGFNVLRGAVYVLAAIAILLAFWGTAVRHMAPCIVCTVIYVPACLLLSGPLYGGLIFLCLLAIAITTACVNKAWKTA